MTRLTDAAIHDRDMFIKPAGLGPFGGSRDLAGTAPAPRRD
jgi:hypothetical protein